MDTLCLITLGCPKNIVEGETLAGIFSRAGFRLTTDLSDARYAVVHTCAFIADARTESAQVVEALSKMRREGRLRGIAVTGCMVQGEGRSLKETFPDVDVFVGTGELERVPGLLRQGAGFACTKAGGLLDYEPGVRLLSSRIPSAYLRIAEGCNHRCAFCRIPQLRGRYRSRRREDIVAEARGLVSQGVREAVIVAQDTTWYGKDRSGRLELPRLLGELARIEDLRWIRLLYAYPDTVTDELLDVMRSEEKIVKYLDIPLQHVSERVLSSMRRSKRVRPVIERIRKKVPNMALRTTFIVGFPGERTSDFRELKDFVAEGWFDHCGVFEYSPWEAPAARKDPGRAVGETVKRERRRELMLVQRSVVRRRNRARIGSRVEALIERREAGKDRWSGRAAFQAPEIDSRLYCTGKTREGKFVEVEITGTKGYDLFGTIRA